MTTYDIQRYAVSGDIAYPIHEDPEGEFVTYEDHVAAIEADRKRRGEPTAAEISNVVREITGCPDIKSGEKSLVVSLGMLFHSCAAPQPAEPVKRKRPYAQSTALGEFGIIPMCDQVNDEPVKVPSDADILDLWTGDPTHSRPVMGKNKVIAFARALLDRYGQHAEQVEGARVATDPSLPELSIVWHDSPEGVDRAMWEEAAQDAGLSYEDLRDSVSVGQDENGAPVELTHAQTIDAIRNQGCWGFVDTNTGTIHAWAADDADPMLVVHMLAHEIGHMTGEQHPDELQEEMRAEQFGRVAAMAFRMWRQRWPLTIVEGAQ